MVAEITTGDHSKRADRRERTRFRAAECVLAITFADDFALEPTRQIQISYKWLARIGRSIAWVKIALRPTRVVIPIASMLLATRSSGVARTATERPGIVVSIARVVIARIQVKHGTLRAAVDGAARGRTAV
jgi:hypothetical protein